MKKLTLSFDRFDVLKHDACSLDQLHVDRLVVSIEYVAEDLETVLLYEGLHVRLA